MKKTTLLAQAIKSTISRNWQAKLVALVLAFLFWYAVKSELGSTPAIQRQRVQEALEQHSIGRNTQL
jgi:type II secretory pathway component PulL